MIDQNEGFSNLDNLYKEVIMEHYRQPSNKGTMENPDAVSEGYNPLCGDRVKIMVRINEQGQVSETRFSGEGCSICMASASMLTDEIEERELGEVLKSIEQFRSVMKGESDVALLDGDLESFGGVRKFPIRIKCVLLPWTTLNDAIKEYRKKTPG